MERPGALADATIAEEELAGIDRSKLAAVFRRVLVVDDDAVCRRLNAHFLQLFILPSLGIAEDGLAALRALLVGCPPQLLAACLQPGVHEPPDDDETAAWLAERRVHGWPFDLVLLDVQMPLKVCVRRTAVQQQRPAPPPTLPRGARHHPQCALLPAPSLCAER